MSTLFHAIREAEGKDDENELQRIFGSITTEQLNSPISIDPNTILLHQLIHHFDRMGKYQHLVIGLFNSPTVDTSRLNINYQNQVNGRTALMFAAGRGNLDVVKKLMELGADMQITTADNRTAFAYACWFGHIEVVKFLLPWVELREYTLSSRATWNNLSLREFMEEKVADNPEKPYLDILKLLNISYEEKLAEFSTRTR